MAGNNQRSHITGNGKQELQFLKFHPLTVAPLTGNLAQFYYNTVDLVLRIFNGTTWDSLVKVASSMTAQKLMVGNGYSLEPITPPSPVSFVKVNAESIASTVQFVELDEINPDALTVTITAPGVDTLIPTEKAVVDYVDSKVAEGIIALEEKDFTFNDIDVDAGQEYIINLKAHWSYRIDQLTLKCDTGSITVTVFINGVPVLGLTEVIATDIRTDFDSTGNNTVSIGDIVTLSIVALVDSPLSLSGNFLHTLV